MIQAAFCHCSDVGTLHPLGHAVTCCGAPMACRPVWLLQNIQSLGRPSANSLQGMGRLRDISQGSDFVWGCSVWVSMCQVSKGV